MSKLEEEAKEYYKKFIESDKAKDAEVTSGGVMLSKEDVLKLMADFHTQKIESKDEKIELLFRLAWSLYNGPEIHKKNLTWEQKKEILSNVVISSTSEDAGTV